MPVFQAFNKKIGAWVKFHYVKGGVKFFDVKQRKPKIKFKGIPVRGNK